MTTSSSGGPSGGPPGASEAFRGLPRIDLRPGGEGVADRAAWRERCARSAGLAGAADAAAREIIADVRARGDAAVIELTARFEGRRLDPAALEIGADRRAAAAARVSAPIRAALELAARRVREFHETQAHATTGLVRAGERLHSRVAPLRRVAVYAPGGTAAYPSSVLMAGIPAKVAGVDEVLLLTPRASDVVLLAAELAGIDRVFEIGGAQAIAAAALGTATIPRVDKIVGPGNAYVTAAKRQVFGLCDIDGIAGPSEILVLADATADPELVAADLLSQAEHDLEACAILVTDHPPLVDATDAALARQLADLPRRELATAALHDHGAAVLVPDRAAMARAADEYAPEHLELLVADPEALAEGLRGAGAIFVGPFTPEAAGDYTAGPSHVLPTAGAARFGSPLGVWDFVKHTSVLALSREALLAQAEAIVTLARAEGLEAHARAVERRLPTSDPAPRPSTSPVERTLETDALPWARHLRPTLAALSVYDLPPADPAQARMHANECPEPWPAEVMAALGEVIQGIELGRYPDTSGRRLRAVLGRRHGCDPDRIVLGNGSDEVIGLLLQALSSPGSAPGVVVTPIPTFFMYGHIAHVLGMEVREVLLREDLELPDAPLDDALAGASVCFLARPNNPTGSLWSAERIHRLVAEHPDVVFVIDEAYAAYAPPGSSLWDPAGPSNQVYMSTLSKVGLAALRVGYCIAHPALARAMNTVRPPYNVSATSLAIAETVLERFGAVQDAMIARALESRARLRSLLAELPGAQVLPSAGNLVLVRLRGDDEAPRLAAHLAARGVLVKDVSRMPRLQRCLRVSLGTPAELDRLAEALRSWDAG